MVSLDHDPGIVDDCIQLRLLCPQKRFHLCDVPVACHIHLQQTELYRERRAQRLCFLAHVAQSMDSGDNIVSTLQREPGNPASQSLSGSSDQNSHNVSSYPVLYLFERSCRSFISIVTPIFSCVSK